MQKPLLLLSPLPELISQRAPESAAAHQAPTPGVTFHAIRVGALAALAASAGSPLAAAPEYGAATAHHVGAEPRAVAFADLNRDGRPDLITGDFQDDQVSVLLGRRGLSFTPAKSYKTGFNPWAFTLGDLNGDGQQDVVSANCWGLSISVLLGNGKGALGAKTDYPVSESSGACPQGVTMTDLNRDGKPDVVVAIETGHAVKTLLGEGRGKLGAPAPVAGIPATAMPVSVAAADTNRDGIPDLIVADAHDNAILILRGKGDGTLAIDASYPVGASPKQAAVADVNKDGILDILTANETDRTVGVLIGKANGSFATAVLYAAGVAVRSIAVADTDADGILDVITGNGLSAKLSIMPGLGDGTFGPVTSFAAGPFTNGVAAADLNHDGRPELAAANQNGNTVSVFRNLSPKPSAGNLQNAGNRRAGTDPTFVATGDVNRDGVLDLVVANQGSSDISVIRGRRSGGFRTALSVSLPAGVSAPKVVAIGDMNRDSKPDLAIAGAGGVALLLGQGNGTFALGQAFPGVLAASLAIGDFDGNGAPDLVAANPADDKVTTIRQRADGRFLRAARYAVGDEPVSLKLLDLNRDGRLDIAVANRSGNTVSLLQQARNHTFTLAGVSPAVGTSPRSLDIGDLNGDGRTDIAVANHDSENVSILLGRRTGGFAPAVNYAAGAQATGLTLADLNRDGIIDLAVASDGGARQSVRLLLGKRGGAFSAPVGLLAGQGLSSVANGDFNGDGTPDLVVTNGPGNLVSTFLNH